MSERIHGIYDLGRTSNKHKGDVMERRTWKLEPLPIHGWRIVDSDGTVIVGDVYEFETGAQIVNDHNQHTALVEQRDLLAAALRRIAAYPSGYKFSGVISDEPSAGKDREEMIHLARATLKDINALATVEQGGESR